MHIAILGSNFGAVHARLYKNKLNISKLTVFARNKEKLMKLQQELGCNITTNFNDILSDSTIDLVDICLPSKLHAEYAIKAIEHGKHVLLETPVAFTPEEVTQIIEYKNKFNRQVYVNMFMRYESYYEYLYDIVKANNYGRLEYLNIYRKTPAIWGDLGLSNISTSLMIHEFDVVTWILGKPLQIKHSAIQSINDKKSHVDALLMYKDTLVSITADSMMPKGHPFVVGYEAVFENALIRYHEEGYADREVSKVTLFKDGQELPIELTKSNCYLNVLEQVITAVNTGKINERLKIEESLLPFKLTYELKPR